VCKIWYSGDHTWVPHISAFKLRAFHVISRGREVLTKTMTKETKELNKVKKLEKEIAHLRQENNLLKKWQRFLAEQKRNASNS
jgi:hypothetical protein